MRPASSAIFLIMLISMSSLYSILSKQSHNKQLNSLIEAKSDDQIRYSIERALQFLIDLQVGTSTELDNLREAWKSASADKNNVINDLTQQAADQTTECNAYQDNVDELIGQIQNANATIGKKQQQIADNEQLLKDKLQQRCESNDLYIQTLMNNQISMSLFEYLRSAIEGYSVSFLQSSKNEVSQLSVFLQGNDNLLQNSPTLSSLLEAFMAFGVPSATSNTTTQYTVDSSVKERTADEIGTGHIDNTQGEIVVSDLPEDLPEGFGAIKTKLLNLLDELESGLRQTMADQEVAEVNAADAMSDLMSNIEQEDRSLQRDINGIKDDIVTLQARLIAAQDVMDNCQNKLDSLNVQVISAQKDLDDSTASFNAQEADFIAQLALFDQLIALYSEKVVPQDAAYGQRVDDYIPDQKFDDTTFEARETESYDQYAGQVRQTLNSTM